MKKLGVFTSGGDSPGMNAALRSVVRTAIHHKVEVYGIERGYQGMIEGKIKRLYRDSVSNIIQRGGTFLRTARSEDFFTEKARAQAADVLKDRDIEALIAIGGDGTFQGAEKFSKEWQIRVIGVPGTIDNDIYGTDYTVGYDTALNTALSAVDRIRDTAAAHDRVFFVEVMGRQAGFIALDAGVAGGAEQILTPEEVTDIDEVANFISDGMKKGKTSSIVVVAEGDDQGGALDIAKKIKAKTKLKFRVSILGYIQRGGAPTARDRILATKLGAAAVEAFLGGKDRIMVGEVDGKIVHTPLIDTFSKKKPIDKNLLKLSEILAL